MKARYPVILSLLAATAIFALKANETSAAAENTIGMVTGPKTGTYITFGRDIASVAKASGLDVDVKESGGSIDNIKRITSDENAAIGIVQSDVLGFLARSKNPESVRIANELRMIYPLNREEIHVLARTNINSFSELSGKRVVVGAEGSGSMLTSVNLFALMRVNPAEMVKISPPEGLVKVLKGEADAMIFVGGKPVRLFKNLEDLAKSGEANAQMLRSVRFLPMNDPKMLQEYAPSQLTHDDYSYITGPVSTIAVNAVLVSYDFSSPSNPYHKSRCKNLDLISKSIKENIAYLKSNGHPKWKEVDLYADVGYWKRDICSWHNEMPVVKENALQRDLLSIINSAN